MLQQDTDTMPKKTITKRSAKIETETLLVDRLQGGACTTPVKTCAKRHAGIVVEPTQGLGSRDPDARISPKTKTKATKPAHPIAAAPAGGESAGPPRTRIAKAWSVSHNLEV